MRWVSSGDSEVVCVCTSHPLIYVNTLCLISPLSGYSGGLLNGHVSTSQPSCAQDTSQLVQDTTLSRPELQDRPIACPELLVMDLRSYAAVLGNRAKGGGCECTGEPCTTLQPLIRTLRINNCLHMNRHFYAPWGYSGPL